VTLVLAGQGAWRGAAHAEPADGLQVIETTTVAFRLEGDQRVETLQFEDFDIVWSSGQERFLPLFLLCEKLEIPCREELGVVRFQSADGDSVTLDLATQQASRAGQTQAVSLRIGKSDTRGSRDIFVLDSQLAGLLGLTLQWDEGAFAYRATSEAPVPKVLRLRAARGGRRIRSQANQEDLAMQGIEVPEIAPPALPTRFADPSLGTIRPALQISTSTAGYSLVNRSLQLWGRLLQGECSASLRQTELELRSFTRLDEASWFRSFGNVEANVGDVLFGLNELILPSASISGLEINGVLGSAPDDYTIVRSNAGRSTRFGTELDFPGYAPLGSTVHIYRGDRLLAEQRVVEADGAPLGQGSYHFRGINLLPDERNEIRIEVVEQDGATHEYTREVVGTDRLLAPGRVTFIGGVGTRRLPDESFWYTQGSMGGGRLSLGLLPSMTVTGLLAWQREYAFTSPVEELHAAERSSQMQVPRESYHSGMELAWRFLDRVVLSSTAALSRASADSVARYAGRASAILPWGPFRLRPEVFLQRPGYFNGSGRWFDDRQGWASSLLWRSARSSSLIMSGGLVEDDVDGTKGVKTIVDWQRVNLRVPRLPLRTEADFIGEHLAVRHGEDGYLWSIASKANVPFQSQLILSTTWGDEAGQTEGRKLIQHLGITDSPGLGRNGWELSVRRPLFKNGLLNLVHSDRAYRKRTYASHVLQARGKSHVEWRLEGGYDWVPRTSYAEIQFKYRLDESGLGSVGVFARSQRHEWTLGVNLSLRPTIGLRGARPFLLTKSRIDPQIGGLEGRVFMDRNGDGLPEPGEPGIGGIEVITDSGQRLPTSDRGAFILPAAAGDQEVRIRLNPLTVPAYYEMTNGAQKAEIRKGSLTRVGLGLIILNSISGAVLGPNPQDSTRIGLGGVRVFVRAADGEIVRESVTAGDGIYYLGELKPGDYMIDVDERTLPAGYRLLTRPDKVSLEPTKEPVDIDGVNIECSYTAPPPSEKNIPKKDTLPQIDYKKF
jgi:hypothetical protein